MSESYIDLKDRVAVITGASRGIGAEVAKSYAKAGAHVVLLARTVGGLEEVDDAISAAGGKATLIPQDLMDLDAIDTLGPALAEKLGRVDIFVGNAGTHGTLTPMPHMKASDWDNVFKLNVTANFRLIRTLDPLLRQSDAGKVILTSSLLAQKEWAYWSAYCASKAALEMMAKCYAEEVDKTNISIHVVDPGVVDTAMLRDAFPGGFQGDVAQPEDVAPAFLKLALAKPSDDIDLARVVVG